MDAQNFNEYIHTHKLFELLKIEGGLSDSFRQKINKQAQQFLQNVMLLHDLDTDTDSEEDIKTIISILPEALSASRLGTDVIPIRAATYRSKSMPFIPLLAEKGVGLKVGGNEGRGGLINTNMMGRLGELLDDPSRGRNIFKDLCSHTENQDVTIRVLEELREMGLFTKNDVSEFDLLTSCSHYRAWDVFHYLINCNREVLKTWRSSDGLSFLHHYLEAKGRAKLSFVRYVDPTTDSVKNLQEDFEIILNASLKLYPERLGLLFQHDPRGGTVLTKACSKLGTSYVSRTICNGITDIDTIERLFQITPANRIFPFMLAATAHEKNGSGEATLSIIYHLLRLDPTIIENGIQNEN